MEDNPEWFTNILSLEGHINHYTNPFHSLMPSAPFVAIEQRPRRTFKPKFTKRYGSPTLKPKELVRYSRKYGYSRLFNFPYRGAGWRPRMFTIVLQIHGLAAPIHQGGPIRAAGSVFFAEQNMHNHGILLQPIDPQTNHRALLAALRFALQELIEMRHTVLDAQWKEAIIMTNNNYVIRSFSEWVWQWERNGWQHVTRGGLIAHADVISDCQNLMTFLEQFLNTSVRFWKVGKKSVAGAHENAKKTFNNIITLGL